MYDGSGGAGIKSKKKVWLKPSVVVGIEVSLRI